jgi:RNA polymerase sigma-70 factor (ECF subfamily)
MPVGHNPSESPALDGGDLFASNRRHLWGLCYRMTGSAADADDLVQDTFVRALERPPARRDEPLRPWLVAVALNLARDALRRRRRRGYHGPWLPSPVETVGDEALPSFEIPSGAENPTEGRYELMESVSYAFLVALEALTPQQRAVLLLRDVFDYSVSETGAALGLSDANVKTSLHRARKAMSAYDRARPRPTAELASRTRAALEAFLAALTAGDVGACRSLLAEQVVALSDGGDEFLAAKVPVVGRDRVLKLEFGLMRSVGDGVVAVTIREMNGLPAAVIDLTTRRPRYAPRVVLRCDLDADGKIVALHTILATDKLTAIRRR